ncbi:YitT family protein [uncultured Celeribacter sp.]|uniref:YitT family protein n=1 Tax=uncultured Celeribacter sp. TaxID=1303376 RepID=UPI002AA620E0|nr:YitT family protein [uncultured Celeribacter sp.]
MPTDAQKPEKHTWFEDLQGYIFGTSMCAFALVMLRSLGLITGQMAGLAVLISYVSGLPFGWVFFAVNLPFYWFGYKRMGKVFVVKTFINVALISVLSEWFPSMISFEAISPLFGAIMVGFMTGAGLMAIFRHGGSLGGLGILALYLQDATGVKAGYVQLAFDACLFAIAFFIMPLPLVVYSLVGAVVVNLVIAINHRRDRYIAM